MRVASVVVLALVGCNGSAGPVMPMIPADAVMDTYDAWVLQSTSSVAPTYQEVQEPRDETPRRFRAWLGWGLPRCPECPPTDNMHCAPCDPPLAYVCARPARVIRCAGEDIVSIEVSNGDRPIPPNGVYVFEGAWKLDPAGAAAPVFDVTRVEPLFPPDAGAADAQ